MQRVTGVSVVDGQYVFVRGLGERYSNTQLNGAIIPTTEPDKKVVPLDLFPSGTDPERSGARRPICPTSPAISPAGSSRSSLSTFPDREDLRLLPRLRLQQADDGQGFPDLSRWRDATCSASTTAPARFPAIIPTDAKVVRGNAFTGGGFSRDELQTFGRSFANVWEPRLKGSATPNQSYSLVWGNSTEKLGAVFSFSYNYSNQSQTEVQNFYKVSDDSRSRSKTTTTSTCRPPTPRWVWSATLRTSSTATTASRSRTSSPTTPATRRASSRDSTRIFEQRYPRPPPVLDRGADLLGQSLGRALHPRALGNSRIDWRATFSRATRDEPDLRETLYEDNAARDEFVLADESQSGFRMFNDLDDNIYETRARLELLRDAVGRSPDDVQGRTLCANYRERDFSSRRFRFRPIAPGQIDIVAASRGALRARRTSARSSSCAKRHATPTPTRPTRRSPPLYGMVDLPLSERWRVIGGLVSSARTRTSTRSICSPSIRAERATIRPRSSTTPTCCPASTSFTPCTGARTCASATADTSTGRSSASLRPSSSPTSSAGRAIVGNPDLVAPSISQLRRSLGVVSRPRARSSRRASSTRTSPTPSSEPSRRRRSCERPSPTRTERGTRASSSRCERRSSSNLFVFGELHLRRLETSRLDATSGQVQTSTDRPLAGQSANVFNATSASSRCRESNCRSACSYNWFDDRIVDVGSLGLPDIIEQGR